MLWLKTGWLAEQVTSLPPHRADKKSAPSTGALLRWQALWTSHQGKNLFKIELSNFVASSAPLDRVSRLFRHNGSRCAHKSRLPQNCLVDALPVLQTGIQAPQRFTARVIRHNNFRGLLSRSSKRAGPRAESVPIRSILTMECVVAKR